METRYTLVPCHEEGDDKVAAIKSLRALTGMGLKESKDLVESVWDGNRHVIDVGVVDDFVYNRDRLLANGVKLTNHRKDNAEQLVKELKALASFAVENDCYAIGKDILDVLNKHDRKK